MTAAGGGEEGGEEPAHLSGPTGAEEGGVKVLLFQAGGVPRSPGSVVDVGDTLRGAAVSWCGLPEWRSSASSALLGLFDTRPEIKKLSRAAEDEHFSCLFCFIYLFVLFFRFVLSHRRIPAPQSRVFLTPPQKRSKRKNIQRCVCPLIPKISGWKLSSKQIPHLVSFVEDAWTDRLSQPGSVATSRTVIKRMSWT